MANLSGFNAENIDPLDEYTPIPGGDYIVEITTSEMKTTKKGDGQFLELKMKVIDGEHKNRVLFDILNLNNPNTQAVEMAKRTLSSICHATGVMQPNDSAELHGIPLTAVVKIKKRSDNGELKNEVANYKAIAKGLVVESFEAAGLPTQAPAQGRKEAAPWQ